MLNQTLRVLAAALLLVFLAACGGPTAGGPPSEPPSAGPEEPPAEEPPTEGANGEDPAPGTSDWTFRENKDPITDEDRSYIVATGDNAYLFLRCGPGYITGFQMYLSTPRYVGNGSLDYRVDDRAPVLNVGTSESADGTALFFHSDTINRFKEGELIGAKQVLFRVYNYRGVASSYTIPIAGWEQAYEKIAYCHDLRGVPGG